MGKIVAIGGGDSVQAIDSIHKEIVKLSGKKIPKLLYLPTASEDLDRDYIPFAKYLAKKFKCKVQTLLLIRESPSKIKIKDSINKADIIYVGGGNTLRMMRLWRHAGVDKLLIKAHKEGKVMCGVSAGSICWFHGGSSDSLMYYNPKVEKYIYVHGLGIINTMNAPHFQSKKQDGGLRTKLLYKKVIEKKMVAIAIEDNCAVEINGSKYRVIRAKKGANAYKVFLDGKQVVRQPFPPGNKYRSLNELLMLSV